MKKTVRVLWLTSALVAVAITAPAQDRYRDRDDDRGRRGPWRGDRLTEEYGFDYRGGDYHDFRVRNAEVCQEECRQDRRCEAYTYNRRSGVCYLKDRLGRLQRNSDTVTGTKQDGRDWDGRDPRGDGREGRGDRGDRLGEEYGYDYRGGDYADFRSRSVRECKQQCREDRRCVAYTFNQRTSVCYLKDRVGTALRNRDTVTGARGY